MEWVNMRLSELAAIRERFSLGLVLDMSLAQAAAGVGRGYRVLEAVRRNSPCAGRKANAAGTRDTARERYATQNQTMLIQSFAIAHECSNRPAAAAKTASVGYC